MVRPELMAHFVRHVINVKPVTDGCGSSGFAVRFLSARDTLLQTGPNPPPAVLKTVANVGNLALPITEVEQWIGW